MPPFGLSNEEFEQLNKSIRETYQQGLAFAAQKLDGITSEFMKRELDEHVQRVISFAPLLTLKAKTNFEVKDEKLIPAINGYISAQAKKIWETKKDLEFDGTKTVLFMSPKKMLEMFTEMYPFTVDDLEQHDVIDSIASYVIDGTPKEIAVDMAIEELLLHIRMLDFEDEMIGFFRDIQSKNYVVDFEEQLYWLNPETFYDHIIRPFIREIIQNNKEEVTRRVIELI